MYTRIDDKVSNENFVSYQKDGSLKIDAFNKSFRLSSTAPDDGTIRIALPIFIAVFILITILLAVVFFFFGPEGKKFIYTLAGFGLGILISVLIWFFWGKNHYKL